MKDLWTKLKPKLLWILAGSGVIFGGFITVLTFGKARPKFGKPLSRPQMDAVPNIVIPTVNTDFKTDLNDAVAEDYEAEKAKSSDVNDDSVMDELNEMG